MLIGMMNHPAKDVMKEIDWIAENGLEFLDLTLEPPGAPSWGVDPKAIRRALEANGLAVVGHTAYYLPMASAIEGLRQAAVEEFRRCIEVFSEVGVKWMNLHPDSRAPMHNRKFFVQRNIQTLEDLLPTAQKCGVGLMIENLPGEFNNPTQLGEILDVLPEVGLHLDLGHANLKVGYNTAEAILKAYGSRLKHAHLHDNKGGDADLHLPLGAGTMDVARQVKALHATGYDGTITLEVFSPDQNHLLYSRDRLREMWSQLGNRN